MKQCDVVQYGATKRNMFKLIQGKNRNIIQIYQKSIRVNAYSIVLDRDESIWKYSDSPES